MDGVNACLVVFLTMRWKLGCKCLRLETEQEALLLGLAGVDTYWPLLMMMKQCMMAFDGRTSVWDVMFSKMECEGRSECMGCGTK